MSALDDLPHIPSRILDAISPVIGKEEAKKTLIAALLCGGHVLIEGVTGTAKTLLAKAFARAIGGQFKRIQLTADVLPTDITGFFLYTPNGERRLIRGPMFANIVLADEINRTTTRTQAAFLESMQEGQVTIEGEYYPLPAPFMVVASQQPLGSEGTYPLTGVQSDRFMFRVWSGYPELAQEVEIIGSIDALDDPAIPTVVTPEQILRLREMVKQVYVAAEVRSYSVAIVRYVRDDPDVLVGPSPRGSIALHKGARAMAFLEGRDYVLPDDVKQLIGVTLTHRIRLKDEAEVDGVSVQTILDRALEKTEVPKFDR